MLKNQVNELNYESQIIINDLLEYLSLMKYSMSIQYINEFSKYGDYKLFSRKLIDGLFKAIEEDKVNFKNCVGYSMYSILKEDDVQDEYVESLIFNVIETECVRCYAEIIRKVIDELTIYKIMSEFRNNECYTDIFYEIRRIKIEPFRFITGFYFMFKIVLNGDEIVVTSKNRYRQGTKRTKVSFVKDLILDDLKNQEEEEKQEA